MIFQIIVSTCKHCYLRSNRWIILNKFFLSGKILRYQRRFSFLNKDDNIYKKRSVKKVESCIQTFIMRVLNLWERGEGIMVFRVWYHIHTHPSRNPLNKFKEFTYKITPILTYGQTDIVSKRVALLLEVKLTFFLALGICKILKRQIIIFVYFSIKYLVL